MNDQDKLTQTNEEIIERVDKAIADKEKLEKVDIKYPARFTTTYVWPDGTLWPTQFMSTAEHRRILKDAIARAYDDACQAAADGFADYDEHGNFERAMDFIQIHKEAALERF